MIALMEVDVLLVSLVQFILSIYQDSYCTIIYFDAHSRAASDDYNRFYEFRDTLEDVMNTHGFPVIWIAAGNTSEKLVRSIYIQNGIELGCQSHIIITEDISSFLEMKLDLKGRTTQRGWNQKILLLSQNFTFLDSAAIMQESFNFYPNMWFVTPSNTGGYSFFTHNFSNPEETELNLQETFNDSTISPTGRIFNDKIFNLQGRPLVAGITDYAPYCSLEHVGANRGNVDAYNSTLSKELFLDGLDGTLIVEFCKLRNCNLQIMSFGANSWGEIYENGTGFGMLYSTYDKKTDLAACTVSYSWISNFVDGSHPYSHGAVVVLVPRAKLLPKFLTPLFPFNRNLWSSAIVMLIVMMLVHYSVARLNSHVNGLVHPLFENSVFDIISVYLDQSIRFNTQSSAYCILISVIFLSGVVLSNSYASGLASILTIPRYEKSLETLHDLANSPYHWGTPSVAWVFSVLESESADVQKVIEKFVEVPDLEQLYRRTLNEDFGIGFEHMDSGQHVFGPYLREDNVHLFEALKQPLYYGVFGAVTQRGWPIMEYFNKFVLEAKQHGLVLQWQKQNSARHQSIRLESALELIIAGHRLDDGEGPQRLSVGHISGALIVLGFGTVASCVVFILELLWRFMGACLRHRLVRCLLELIY